MCKWVGERVGGRWMVGVGCWVGPEAAREAWERRVPLHWALVARDGTDIHVENLL